MNENPEIGQSVQAAGLATNFLEQGKGQPVLMIHGSGPGVTGYANWRLTMPALAENHRVIAPDIPGFGYTERPADGKYGLDFWTHHMVSFLDALGIEKTHLVGNSFGGALSLALAARHPDRVDKLVLMGAVGTNFDLTWGLDQVWGYTPSMENMRRLIGIFAYNSALVTDDLVNSRYQASMRPGFQESYARLFPEPRQKQISGLATSEADIAKIPHPTLIVHGRDDKVIPLSNSVKLNHLIRQSELHIFGECGHWTQIEKKDRFNRLIGDFLAS
ncbi:alpha/beta fold hydrolase [Sphingobium sp. BS19]|uniref:alpha/beta fold hydrolase n=1 Tax=Sphingobium sp. BS19 TaxID=3018973 RepID=UPI0022EFA6B1|nr:alpha/beta fold hydrolase [Sphingobium sp. BS19]GLJ00271.1 2,6-dioxo-6-phenylhexa-3-enoate hydrolase [Sphingobium sp. BS19]